MIKLIDKEKFKSEIERNLISNRKFIEELHNGDHSDYYELFNIRKRDRSFRKIEAPSNRRLKFLQKNLSIIFYKYIEFDECINGFVRNRSIKNNASIHLNSEVIVNIDIRNFFNSIKRDRIVSALQKHPFQLEVELAELLSKVATKNDYLPQGSPLSPVLSNIGSRKLDTNLSDYCIRKGIRYSRYADDMSFSLEKGRIENDELSQIRKIIEDSGFRINEKKFKIKRKYKCLTVTGLVVNGSEVNVKRRYIKRVKAALHRCEYTHRKFVEPRLQSLRSRIEFIGMIRGKDDLIYKRFMDKYNNIADNLSRLPFKMKEENKVPLPFDNDQEFANQFDI